MSINQNTKKEVLDLEPLDKIKLIDELLLSLDIPNKDIDELWQKPADCGPGDGWCSRADP